jgi:hypothetical protein
MVKKDGYADHKEYVRGHDDAYRHIPIESMVTSTNYNQGFSQGRVDWCVDVVGDHE